MSYDPNSAAGPYDPSRPGYVPPRSNSGGIPPAKPRRSSVWLILGMIAMVVFGCLVLCAGFVALVWYTDEEVPVTAQDREVVITAHDVRETMMEPVRIMARYETTRKTRSTLDGAISVEYEYDDGEDGVLYVLSTVIVERDAKAARLTYTGMKMGVNIFVRIEGDIEERQHDDVFKWGDASKFVTYYSDGEPFGNMFIARKGKRIFYLETSGVYYDYESRESFDSLVSEKLRRLERYNP